MESRGLEAEKELRDPRANEKLMTRKALADPCSMAEPLEELTVEMR